MGERGTGNNSLAAVEEYDSATGSWSSTGPGSLAKPFDDPIVGVVGALHFEVLQSRVEHEYGARVMLERQPFSPARWVAGRNFDPKTFDWEGKQQSAPRVERSARYSGSE